MPAPRHNEPLSESLVPVLYAIKPHVTHVLFGHFSHHLSNRINYLDPIDETELESANVSRKLNLNMDEGLTW